MHGRVEHVVSRQAIHFTSLDALLAFMARVLREEDAHEEQLKTEAARLSALDSSQT
jgi:hypothetical protein